VADQMCEARNALLKEFARKSDEVAKAANRLSKLASKDRNATLEDKVNSSNTRTLLEALMRDSEDIHDKLKAHRDEHGC
jgi:hypothetical protein